MKLSVVIPAYNEERRLPNTLKEVDKYLRDRPYEYEILVVNDGSKDGTAETVKKLALEIKNLRLIDNKANKGKGGVVRQGMLEARGEIRLFMDADNSTSVSQVEKMWSEFEKGFSLVIGSRDIKGAKTEVAQPFYRVLLGDIFNLVVQFILGLWGIFDTQCGFKAMTAEAAQKILPQCRIDRWAFDPEILVIGRKMGYKIKEVPVHWVNDPESKVKFKGMVRMLREILEIRWNLITHKYI